MLNSLKLEKINPTLVNLTGIRLLVIFSLLLDSPKTAEQINEHFIKNNYPKELFSVDTLRNDMNALRLAGCDISRADKRNDFKYILLSHPFELKIDMYIAKSLSKLYNSVYKNLNFYYLLLMDDLFIEFSKYADDVETSEYLRGISLFKNIDKKNIKDLIFACDNKKKVSFTYKAPNTGKQQLEFITDGLEFRNRKFYLKGYNVTFQTNSFLLVSRIVSPITLFLKDDVVNKEPLKVVYLIKNLAKINFEESEQEKVVEFGTNEIKVEFTTENEFKLLQKILSYGPNCTVISPDNFKQRVIETLHKMREVYENA